MPTTPLTPEEVERLLHPDARTTTADLLALRDALHRMSDAFTRMARAAEQLERSARALERMARSATGQPAEASPPRAA